MRHFRKKVYSAIDLMLMHVKNVQCGTAQIELDRASIMFIDVRNMVSFGQKQQK